ncbi:DUF2933 domain-containing protein, partial [Aeromonas caviae]
HAETALGTGRMTSTFECSKKWGDYRYFLVTERWAHFMGALPYLLLLACPLMHVFMHGGHGDNHENGDHGSDEKKQNIQKSSPTKMINLIKENPYE